MTLADILDAAKAGAGGAADAVPAAPPPITPQAAPQQPQEGSQTLRPGLLDILQGVLWHGQSPAEAALDARSRMYANSRMQMIQDALQSADPALRAAILFNAGETGKALAQNYAPVSTAPGATTTFMGGPHYTAPLMGFDATSGRGYTQVPGATVPTGPSLGGGFKAENGVVVSDRTGQTSGRYALPQTVPFGSRLDSFTPGVSGPGSMPPAAPGQVPPGGPGAPGGLDPRAFYKSFVLPHEGGLNAHDMNGSPTFMGFNQRANPDIDVKTLTPDTAADRFASKYYGPSGAASLPPALAAVHADTSFINPAVAQQFLKASGGDPNTYMGLREAWMNHMLQTDPAAAPYAAAWAKRNADLRAYSGQVGGGRSPTSTPDGSAISTVDQGIHPLPLTDPAERQRWGIDPNDRSPYAMTPDGPKRLGDAPYQMKDVLSQRDAYFKSPEYQDYTNSVNAVNALEANLKRAMGNGAVVDQAVTDNTIRAMTGLSARQGSVNSLLDHLDLPNDLKGKISKTLGGGFLSPQVLMQMRAMIHAYADGHKLLAQQRLDSETAFAKGNGFDLGVQLPDPSPMSPVPWLGADGQVQGVQLPPNIPAAGQRKPGVYDTPRGPMRWDGQRWHPTK